MHVKIAPFSGADLEEASELLARCHQGDRAHELALPERFTHPLDLKASNSSTSSPLLPLWSSSCDFSLSIALSCSS
jgi:hypothetical protein